MVGGQGERTAAGLLLNRRIRPPAWPRHPPHKHWRGLAVMRHPEVRSRHPSWITSELVPSKNSGWAVDKLPAAVLSRVRRWGRGGERIHGWEFYHDGRLWADGLGVPETRADFRPTVARPPNQPGNHLQPTTLRPRPALGPSRPTSVQRSV